MGRANTPAQQQNVKPHSLSSRSSAEGHLPTSAWHGRYLHCGGGGGGGREEQRLKEEERQREPCGGEWRVRA